jgi:hypothetical protein
LVQLKASAPAKKDFLQKGRPFPMANTHKTTFEARQQERSSPVVQAGSNARKVILVAFYENARLSFSQKNHENDVSSFATCCICDA